MSQKQNQELFTTYQVKVWMIDCAALQADTLIRKNIHGGLHLKSKLGTASVYNAIRLLMEVFTKIPKGHRSAHRS